MSKAIRRKEAPELFTLLDRVEALIALEYGTRKDLAEFLKVTPQRIYEWLSARIKHPIGETTLQIDLWATAHEQNIRGRKLTAYRAELAKTKDKHP